MKSLEVYFPPRFYKQILNFIHRWLSFSEISGVWGRRGLKHSNQMRSLTNLALYEWMRSWTVLQQTDYYNSQQQQLLFRNALQGFFSILIVLHFTVFIISPLDKKSMRGITLLSLISVTKIFQWIAGFQWFTEGDFVQWHCSCYLFYGRL